MSEGPLMATADGLIDLDAAARFIGETPKELERLVRIGAVPRENGRFHPVKLVRGYVDHVREEAKRANEKPTQVEIAAHLDMSERNARDVLQKLGIDNKASTLEEIRTAYIRYLRELAAGRGGEDQYDLTKQKARQAEADANLKELEYWTRLDRFVSVDELEPLLASWAATGRSEVENAIERIVTGIESKYGIEIEREIIDAPLDAAFGAIAAYPGVATSGDDKGGEEMEATA